MRGRRGESALAKWFLLSTLQRPSAWTCASLTPMHNSVNTIAVTPTAPVQLFVP